MPRHGYKPYTDRAFSLSPLAGALLLAAGGLLMLGIRRAELASLLWGGTFLALLVFALLGTLLQRMLLSKRAAGFEANLEPSWVRVGDPTSLRVVGRLEAFRVPGVRILYLGRLSWRGLRDLRLSVPLSSRIVDSHGEALRPPRGLYRPGEGRLLITDALGFFRFSLSTTAPSLLTVAPRPRETRQATLVSHREGEEPQRSDRRIRTEELVEVRRYVPGDDVRRINWKQYARWEELFLRIGEEVPPAAQEVTLILRAAGSIGEILPVDYSLRALDRALGLLGDLAASFSSDGLSVRYALREDVPPEALGDLDAPEFLRALADAGWSTGRIPFGSLRGSRCIVLALPDPGLGSYLFELSRAAASVTLLLVEPPGGTDRGYTHRWLLRPPGEQRRDIRRPEAQARERYTTLLESAIVGLDGKVRAFHRV
ncbi:MAG: DUF58 domain-containing protein [Spirochaetaceae bacterium]